MPPQRSPRPSAYAPPHELAVTEHTHGDWLVLVLTGELDISAAPRLAVTVRDHVRRGADAVCIDLSNVVFVDTAGVAALLNCERTLSRADGRFAVLAPPGSFVHELLDQMGTQGLLTVTTSAAQLRELRA